MSDDETPPPPPPGDEEPPPEPPAEPEEPPPPPEEAQPQPVEDADAGVTMESTEREPEPPPAPPEDEAPSAPSEEAPSLPVEEPPAQPEEAAPPQAALTEESPPETGIGEAEKTSLDDESASASASVRRMRRKKASADSGGGEEDEEAEEGAEGDEGKRRESKSTKKKPKHSLSVHLQADINKQRIAAAKKAREERRAALDMQHHFLIEQVAAYLDLKPKDVEEFVVDSAQYIQFMDKFFEKKGSKAVVFVYQESDPPGPDSGRPVHAQANKKEKMLRLTVSDGSDVGLKGKVMFFIRTSNDTKVTIKSIADDTYFGVLDITDPEEPGIVLDAVVFNLNKLLIPYLKSTPSWITISEPSLAASVRHKFLTSIERYCEFLSESKHDIVSRLDLTQVADMTELIEKHLSTPEKVLEATKNPEVVSQVEHIVILWCKNIERVLALSKLMRKDTDIMGPNAELAYWRNLHAKMSFIIQQIQQWQFVHFIQLLIHSKSKVLRRWKDVDARVTDDYHESKDNVRYMYALSKFVEPLYQLDPPGMVQYIPSMMYTIQTIHTTSRYYNSCEKVTALLVKISNQMVYACRRYLTSDGRETIWNQEKRDMIEKLKKCLELYASYRGCYEETKLTLQQNPEGKQFNFSVNHIFGRYDLFCERLRKIITLLEIFDMYKFVHESHIDGIEVISLRLNNLFRNILKKSYDPLEFRQPDFDKDFGTIRASLDEIQKALEAFMDKAIENCPTAMHCLELLERFANLRNRCLNIEDKQWYAFQFYHNEINMLKGIYESEKNDTPIPRGYPPFAGKIAWARHLFRRLERPMLYFQEKTKVLERDDSKPVVQAYNGLAKKLIYFEILFHDAWVKQCAAIYDSLEAPLLTLRGTIRQEMVLNFDPFFRQIIDETEIIRKLDLEIPDVAQIVYYRQDKIFATYEKMKGLLDKFVLTKSKIPTDLTVLIRALLKRVDKSFMPGVTNINWTSFKCDEYFEFIELHLNELEAIAEKIDEILSVRVNQCLYDICHTMMIDLPDDKPMVVQEYLKGIHEYGKIVAKELEYKSRHCEAAVIELINTLVATNELNVPDQILYAWMNPNLFTKAEKKDSADSKQSVMKGHSKKDSPKAGRENLMLQEMISELSQPVREEVSHLHEECRHVFMFYSQKCIEALQKTTRTSLDILRRRTEEPQVNKRNIGKVESRIPLFTSDLILTIPSISLKPPIEETQKVLSRSVTIVVECLKQVVIWGQSRRTSFDASSEDSYFKDISKEDASAEQHTYERLQNPDAYVNATFNLENLNVKLKNCYKPVMDYKDISKMVVIMQSVVTQAKPKIQAMIHKYMNYSYLWRKDRDDEIKNFIDESPAITEVAALMKKYNDLITEIGDIQPKHRIGPLEILTSELKLGLVVEVKTWKHTLCKLLADDYREKALEIAHFIEEMNRDLAMEIKDLADIKFAMERLSRIRDRFVDDEALLTPIEECYSFLAHQGFKVPDEELLRSETLRVNFNLLQAKALATQDVICALQEEHRSKLTEAISKFQQDLKRHLEKYRQRGPMIEGLSPQDASDRLMMFQDEFDALHERYALCHEGEKIFGMVPKEYPEMNKHMKELALLQKLYGLYNDVMRSIDGYSEIKWAEIDIQKIMAELAEFQTRCRRLPKALRDWPAYIVLKKKIDDFNETCPLLELMADKSMKERHWERIGEVTGYHFDLENENFCLKDVLGCPLLKFKDEVEDICIGAGKEKDIEAKMKQIVLDWGLISLQFTSFKNRGEMLLKGQETADVMTQLEDALMILNFLFNNRYSTLYRKELQAHLTDFSNTAQILENWLAVQNLWIYLEAVFVGGDIARQMPLEAKRFQNIDRTWVKIMNRARENPLVIPCCVGDETMGQLLPHLLEQLELCQKSLSGYLESKRKIFPRFFFVSDPVLLEILGQASDSHTIQPHLLSIFENVNEIDWHAKEYNRMLGVISKEGEKVLFEEPGMAEGNVEVWLGTVLTQAQSSLLGVIRDSAYALNATDFDLLEFLANYLAQVGLLGIQILWTRDAENALTNAKRDRRIMQQTNAKFLAMLNILISQTTKNLTKYERIKFETLITIHVHQRDIFDDICKAHIKSPFDFEWLKQARFFFSFEQDSCIVRITNITFRYCNEFMGCTDRLVITPLTDRCYITIAQAAGNSLGANPSGPAGTGKTETSKDMAKALGKYCVVFNCSDQMDFRGLGRIFKGMAQSGSWGCFDEINRVELPVLSVAAQQIHVILQARRDQKEQFIFSDGDLVDMNPEFAVIVTMNPGYAGRVELPENMKVQFRAISMIVPDKQIIIRVKLASCGFLENVVLARKFYTLYRLCEEQLSKQVHYDFGLRNILAVLRTLGFQKRKRVNDAEETVIMAVLRDMNLSKLVDEDEGLFLSLIKDLFPGVTLESVTHDELVKFIAEEVQLAKLINYPSWNLKVIQFYETSLVRHGLMALGPTSAGKTQMMLILMRAITLLGIPHKEVRMNPKAILAYQMFGRLDVATNDWTDGIFSTIWRKALKVKKSEALWIVLDGPVDAVWIENLNSVLDDNKTLTLANGDRIVMGVNVKLVFEPDNVDNASPATVSRVGMVFMSSSVLPWQPILQSWLLKRTRHESELLFGLFDKIFSDLLNFIKINTAPKMAIQDALYIRQAVDLLQGLIQEAQAFTSGNNQKATVAAAHYERLFLFSLMWSVGALLELKDRAKMQEFVTTHESHLDWPKCKPEETIFEYAVGATGQWEHWKHHVEEYVYPPDSVPLYANILVPNVDNVRTNYLIHQIAKEGKAVLLIGEQGTAKTVMVNKYLESYNPETKMSKIINFSSETTPNLFQRTIESFVDKRMGTTYGPPRGRKLTIFIDDINMPVFNDWGDQITNEIVRQLMEMKGIYSLDKPGEFNYILDIQFMAAMIHPGGGRNDIPHRLKRQFCIFNCTLPSDSSMDKIFDVIGMGYFCHSRFGEEIVNAIPSIVPLTRTLWQRTKVKMLPTPAKFHYVFNLRDLSRIWEGMLRVVNKDCNDVKTLLSLWKHECTRVIADRFINEDDTNWFLKLLHSVVSEQLGDTYEQVLPAEPLWVSFMLDPDDMIEQGRLHEDDELPDFPFVYQPIPSFDAVKDRLSVFEEQYNEIVRGAKLDLVFFRDAVLHILRISRIIRTDRGCAMLVGVGGSGKQSLTKLASFLSGYTTFQITLTRAYTVSNLLEDLKELYKQAGQKGKGVAFIFTDNDIKEEGFLEYFNNMLSSGEIANLLAKDEVDEICNELIMPMKREFGKREPTMDNLYSYFISRVRKNLHLVLCFSPVGPKFRSRSLKFPGLVSGCTIDWFSKWPRDALVAVSRHFIANFPIVCPGDSKGQLIDLMATVHDQVSAVCLEYYGRFRRQAHVTPKSYLSFIHGYKQIYRDSRKHYEMLSKRMDTGLVKLQEAAVQVAALSKELVVMEAKLAIASAEADKVLADVTVVATSAQKVKDEVKVVKDAAEELVKTISVKKKEAEAKLELAKPALLEAEEALKTIDQGDIATVRKLGKPPHLIQRVLDMVMILFYKRLEPYVMDMAADSSDPAIGACPKPSWQLALRFMSSNFLISLRDYDLDSMNGEHRDLMEPMFKMKDYYKEKAKQICGNVAGLLSWTKALSLYYGVNKTVLPLKMNLAQSEGQLAKANAKLEKAQETLGEKEKQLGDATKMYEAQMTKRQVVVDEANRCKRKMTLASDLINGLGGERERWTEQSKTFKSSIIRLTGDVVLLTGFLSYTGPFNQEYRTTLLDSWKGELKRRRLPMSMDISLINMLVEPHIVGEWNLHGLPNDELSIQNGIIVNRGPRFPLLIDPQVQGKAWLKSLEKENNLKLTSQNHKYFRQHVEEALSQGLPLLIEDIGEELDPLLDNVLEKNFIKAGNFLKVKLGDSEIEVTPGFRLYMTTKLPNPVYSPEISARTLIIDFTVTMKGLEDQLLGRVISTEKEELEADRVALVEGVTSNRRKMAELEENLLYKLSSIQGSLLDDESIVEVLNTTKSTALDVKEKLFVAAETEKKINVAREEFRPVATRGSILYFLICDMVMVNCMYQTSLNQFLELFDASMAKSEHTTNVGKRIHFINDYLTFEIYRYSSRGFYEPHKFMFTLLMALKIDINRGTVKFNEFQTLIKGGGALDLNAVAPKPNVWMTDVTWLNLVELSKLPRFQNIQAQVTKNERLWKAWFDKDAPEDEHIPDGYQNVDPFYRLLLIRSWCPDRVTSQARKYVGNSLGQKFASPVVLSLDEMYNESRPNTPCCCFLSMGSDPTPQIETLAKRLHFPIKSISMGQGQEIHARALLASFMVEGGWVLLQNCHLGLDFMTELLNIILEAEEPHATFRLWLTTEVHPQFPISLLQICIKFTNDPPQGVKAGLKRTYTSITSDTLEYTNATQWRPMLYAISFLHSVVQERRKFGALGWNIPYEFNWADWAACVQFFQTHLDEIDPKKGVSWVTIRYMVGEVHYGGRVTDEYDKRLLGTFSRVWLSDAILQEGFQFTDGYGMLKLKTIEDYVRVIDETLPNNEQPGVYGLHRNAGITYQSNTAKNMLDTILEIQPKDSATGGGETREAIVYRQAAEFLDKLPPNFVPHRIKERITEMGGLTPMNITLRQEIDRMQKVLKVVRQTLTDLKLAIDGTIIMNEALRDALDSIFDAKVPVAWRKVSWQSSTIGFWFTEMLERNAQLVKWLNKGRPNAFWMTGFFNPQGFLTAMKQEVTRAHKGWALDQVALHNEVLKAFKEELGNAVPPEGVYVYGLFIEGAAWDKGGCKIIESAPKILFGQMPVIHIVASDNIKPKDPALYECPVYKKPGRTGLNFICPLWLRSNFPPEHWILRGVALLCDVK